MAKARKAKKTKPERDEAREDRITMEIVVDAYDEGERAMGWYYYLEEKLQFPFLTRCVGERAISALASRRRGGSRRHGPRGAKCLREMFVETPWEHKRTLAVPLSQLEVVHGDEETTQAVEDWHYWVGMGYEF